MKIDSGSTAWVLVSAALVLLMTPALAFFYGGMVRSKHVLGMLMQNFVCIALVSVLWVLGVYSIAFSGGNGWFGNLHQFGLGHMLEPVAGYVGPLAQNIPPLVFVAFQLMFAVITPALITGATADRLKFSAFVVFIAVWVTVVYAPVAHWVFSPTGWLFKLGAEDFAGGTVVHANAGAAALAVAIVIGRRLGWPDERMRPHNVPFVVLGGSLLWFGWFGFNAGSALSAGNLAGWAFVNTNTATAAALLAWVGVERLRGGKPTSIGAASGAVAGLVAITPACGFVSPLGALAIGAIAGAACAFAIGIKHRLGFDDALDVVGIHLVGGVLGALLIGFFGTRATGGVDGLLYGGGFSLLGKQALAVAAVVGYSFVVSLGLAKVVDAILGLRVSEEEERLGLDVSQHGEIAYDGEIVLHGAHSAFARAEGESVPA